MWSERMCLSVKCWLYAASITRLCIHLTQNCSLLTQTRLIEEWKKHRLEDSFEWSTFRRSRTNEDGRKWATKRREKDIFHISRLIKLAYKEASRMRAESVKKLNWDRKNTTLKYQEKDFLLPFVSFRSDKSL